MNNQGDLLQVEGINSRGFGTIPKLLMQDRRLTAEAKAIYAYLCSFCGGGLVAFPRRSKIISDLVMGKNTYYRHFSLLKELGYIRVVQEKDRSGKFVRNVYTLLQIVPCPQNSDTDSFPPPFPKNEDTDNDPCHRYPYTENGDAALSSININKFNINTHPCQTADANEQSGGFQHLVENYVAIVRDNIGYNDFRQLRPTDMKLVDEIVSIIVDALAASGEYVRIDGQERPRALVRRQLMLLDHEAVEHVLRRFKAHTERVKKKRQYLLSMLYNTTLELHANYANLETCSLYDARDQRGARG